MHIFNTDLEIGLKNNKYNKSKIIISGFILVMFFFLFQAKTPASHPHPMGNPKTFWLTRGLGEERGLCSALYPPVQLRYFSKARPRAQAS